MVEVKCYLPRNLFDDVERRCSNLNISKSEYLRLLAKLDVSSHDMNTLANCLLVVDNNIKEIQDRLGMLETR